MATTEQALRELTSNAAYLQSHVDLNAEDFDLDGCRVAAIRGIITVINSNNYVRVVYDKVNNYVRSEQFCFSFS